MPIFHDAQIVFTTLYEDLMTHAYFSRHHAIIHDAQIVITTLSKFSRHHFISHDVM